MSRSIRRSLGSYKMRGLVELLGLKSSSHTAVNAAAAGDSKAATARVANVDGWPMIQLAGVMFLHSARRAASHQGMGSDVNPKPSTKPPPGMPRSRRGGRFPNWAKFVLGSIFSLFLAFGTSKWATLLKIGGEAELVLKEAEQVAEGVEKVAKVVEKVSEEVAIKLPADNKIKEAALIIEHVSSEAVKDAHVAEEIIHKIDELTQDLDDVGEIVEPLLRK